MANVTKRDLVIELSNLSGLRQADTARLMDLFIELASQKLEQGHNLTLRTFGTFEVRTARAKVGRNPNRPDNEVAIPARSIVRFKPGRELKTRVAALPPAG